MADLSSAIGKVPYRLALAGGWIDQPFVSSLNPDGVGSMVVVSIEPTVRFMERCGMATGTRKVAQRMWGAELPAGDRWELMRELYYAENAELTDPSGSQDMAGLLFPGVNRLDYDASVEGGWFPCHVESCLDPGVAEWLERVIHVIPVAPRPPGYNPLDERNLDPEIVRCLGRTGADCYSAILNRDLPGLGDSFNRCMSYWESLLPCVVRHQTLELDLCALRACYEDRYAGAMYSGCGGGYLYVVSEEPVPGGFHIKVRR